MKAPPDPTFWLIYWPFCCSSRSSTNSRTLPAWPKPPDAAWRLASASESRRLAASGDHPTAHNRLPAPVKVSAPAPSSRTPKKTHVSNNDPTILAPMCERRDPATDGDKGNHMGHSVIERPRRMGPRFRRDDDRWYSPLE